MAKSTARKAAPSKAQHNATQAPYGFAPIRGYQAVAYPAGFPQDGGIVAGWALPPSVTMLPQSSAPAGVYTSAPSAGSLTDQLGSTLRLGVDAINAVLVGGIRVLTGFSAYGGDECSCHRTGGCSCCSCCDPCQTECGYDCCCEFGEVCCQPSVGRCC
jgi:hypothetical protein